MSVSKTVKGVASRLSKESGGGKGINNEGELRHIRIEPAENGWTVSHSRKPGKGSKDPFSYDEEQHVFESHHAACKHCKGIMEEHEGGMKALDKNQSGKPVGGKGSKKGSDSQTEADNEGNSGYD